MCLRRTCTVLGDGVVCPSIVGLFSVQSVYATYFIIVFLSKIFAFDETWVPDPYCYCIIKSLSSSYLSVFMNLGVPILGTNIPTTLIAYCHIVMI